ncbi:MAG: hypothetical protein MZW92_23185 [Comamonadaceae bacterium]|nr:hypothetical protein [Comamonadaceae bacterium]
MRGPRGAGPEPRPRSSPPSSGAWPATPTSSSPSACATSTASPRSASNDKFGVDARRCGQRGVGLGRGAGRAQRPGLHGARPAHRDLPHRRAPRLRARSSQRWMREARLRRGARSTRSATSSASTTAADPAAPRLLTGSHYDTVRNGGKLRRPAGHPGADGRACASCTRAGRRLPFGIEVVALRRGGRPALQGHLPRLGRARPAHFDPAWLDQTRRRRRDACARRCAPPACRRRWRRSPR